MNDIVTFTAWLTVISVFHFLAVLNLRRFCVLTLRLFERWYLELDNTNLSNQIFTTYAPHIIQIKNWLGQHLIISLPIVAVNIGTVYWAVTYQQIPTWLQLVCSVGTSAAIVAFINSYSVKQEIQQTLTTVKDKYDRAQ